MKEALDDTGTESDSQNYVDNFSCFHYYRDGGNLSYN